MKRVVNYISQRNIKGVVGECDVRCMRVCLWSWSTGRWVEIFRPRVQDTRRLKSLWSWPVVRRRGDFKPRNRVLQRTEISRLKMEKKYKVLKLSRFNLSQRKKKENRDFHFHKGISDWNNMASQKKENFTNQWTNIEIWINWLDIQFKTDNFIVYTIDFLVMVFKSFDLLWYIFVWWLRSFKGCLRIMTKDIILYFIILLITWFQGVGLLYRPYPTRDFHRLFLT